MNIDEHFDLVLTIAEHFDLLMNIAEHFDCGERCFDYQRMER